MTMMQSLTTWHGVGRAKIVTLWSMEKLALHLSSLFSLSSWGHFSSFLIWEKDRQLSQDGQSLNYCHLRSLEPTRSSYRQWTPEKVKNPGPQKEGPSEVAICKIDLLRNKHGSVSSQTLLGLPREPTRC